MFLERQRPSKRLGLNREEGEPCFAFKFNSKAALKLPTGRLQIRRFRETKAHDKFGAWRWRRILEIVSFSFGSAGVRFPERGPGLGPD